MKKGQAEKLKLVREGQSRQGSVRPPEQVNEPTGNMGML